MRRRTSIAGSLRGLHVRFSGRVRATVTAILVLGTLLFAYGPYTRALEVQVADAAGGCQLAQVAFCDTFDTPSPSGVGTRSGDLNGVVWGVSRSTSDDNPSQGSEFNWNASQLNRCGTTVTVAAPRDVQICNGQLVESVNDGGAVTVLAMYPRQPFDFAGRTGTVAFDVGNDTEGPHGAWPEFVLSDQPVPAPHDDAAGVADFARNSFGVSMAQLCTNGWSVDKMFTTSNYAFALQPVTLTGCVSKPSVYGQTNHVEIHMSQAHQEVWATDAGGTTLREIAFSDIPLPLTRGLAWMEDVHYNANKFGNQGNHSFVWDNFEFDGPVLPRDLGFDVPDATENGTTGGSLGYLVPTGGSRTVSVQNVTNLGAASAALIVFAWWPHDQDAITVAVNGHPGHTMAWPYGAAAAYKAQTLAIPIPVSEVLSGTNSLVFSSTDSQLGGVSVANIDLILVGAGGSSGTTGGIVVSPTPTPTGTPVPTLAAATATVTRTPVPVTATPTRTSGSPTATPTRSPVPPTATPTVPNINTFTSQAVVTPTRVAPSRSVSVNISVFSLLKALALVDLEIDDPTGQKVFQQYWDGQTIPGGTRGANFSATWTVPAHASRGVYLVKIGVFGAGWSGLLAWNNDAATIFVT